MWSKLIIASFLCIGIGDTMFKVVIESGYGYARNTYILAYNFFALVLAAFFCRRRGIRPGRKEIAWGIATGISIGAGTMFGMRALMEIPGILYFPALSAGNLLLVTALSRVLWKERITKRQGAGLVLAAASLILIVS